jgi:hypothetical protein
MAQSSPASLDIRSHKVPEVGRKQLPVDGEVEQRAGGVGVDGVGVVHGIPETRLRGSIMSPTGWKTARRSACSARMRAGVSPNCSRASASTPSRPAWHVGRRPPGPLAQLARSGGD